MYRPRGSRFTVRLRRFFRRPMPTTDFPPTRDVAPSRFRAVAPVPVGTEDPPVTVASAAWKRVRRHNGRGCVHGIRSIRRVIHADRRLRASSSEFMLGSDVDVARGQSCCRRCGRVVGGKSCPSSFGFPPPWREMPSVFQFAIFFSVSLRLIMLQMCRYHLRRSLVINMNS